MLKKKYCKHCKKKFMQERFNQEVCSPECGLEYAKVLIEKTNSKAKRDFKANDKSFLMKKAQEVFNQFIRFRDKDLPCISCGFKGDTRQWHAGHYLTVGARSDLRFNEFNVQKQCSICNNHLSGNLANYRINLILKIGLENVENLEQNRQIKKYTVEVLKEIISIYKLKLKELGGKQ